MRDDAVPGSAGTDRRFLIDRVTGPEPIPGATAAPGPPQVPPPAEVPLAAELRRLARERRTGVLHVGGDGTVHLTEGAVTFADSRRTPGFARLVASPPEPDGTPEAAVAPEPIGEDEPGEARVEIVALFAVLDAVYFLMDSPAVPEFAESPPHPLTHLCRIPVTAVLRECERRRSRPAEGWPSVLVDRAPVVPVRRVHRRRIVLTGAQAEILLNADGRRTPADLARDLGRTAFGCLLAVRTLTTLSLVRRPGPDLLERPREAPPPVPDRPPLPVRRRRRHSPADRATDIERPADTDAPAGRWTSVDLDVLVRLRSGLEELP